MQKLIRITAVVTGLLMAGCAQENLWDRADRPFDGTGLQIVYSSPVDGQSGVPVDAVLEVKFDSDPAPATVPGGIELTVSNSEPVPVSYDINSHTVKITPQNRLIRGATYQLTVNTNITDIYGNPLSAQSNWAFQTADALKLMDVSYSGGGVGLLGDKLLVSFSEAVDTNSVWQIKVTGQTNHLFQKGDAGSFWNSDGTQLTLPVPVQWSAVSNTDQDILAVSPSNFKAAVDGSGLQNSSMQLTLPWSWTNAVTFASADSTPVTIPRLTAGSDGLWLFYVNGDGNWTAAKTTGGGWSPVAKSGWDDTSPAAAAVYGERAWLAAVTGTNKLVVSSASNEQPLTGGFALPVGGVKDLALTAVAADRLYLVWVTTNSPNRIRVALYSNQMWTNVTNIDPVGEDWAGVAVDSYDGKAAAVAWQQSPGTGLRYFDFGDFELKPSLDSFDIGGAGISLAAAGNGLVVAESSGDMESLISDGTGWSSLASFDPGDAIGGNPSAVYRSDGWFSLTHFQHQLHLFYFDQNGGGWTSTGWSLVDDSPYVSSGRGAAYGGRIWVAYYDKDNNTVKVAVH